MRVLVIAPDPLARAGLAALLSGDPTVDIVGQAAADRELAATTQTYRPDLLVWDLGWNPTLWTPLLVELAAELPPILALLADGEAVAPLWTADVRGLLLRESSGEVISAALGALLHGLVVIDPTFAPLLGKETGLRAAESPVEPLTPRELEVLRGLADGLANKEIARRLAISEHTVKFHVNALMGKLGAQSRTEAVVRATRAGVILL